jgi:hypothetical protein
MTVGGGVLHTATLKRHGNPTNQLVTADFGVRAGEPEHECRQPCPTRTERAVVERAAGLT